MTNKEKAEYKKLHRLMKKVGQPKYYKRRNPPSYDLLIKRSLLLGELMIKHGAEAIRVNIKENFYDWELISKQHAFMVTGHSEDDIYIVTFSKKKAVEIKLIGG